MKWIYLILILLYWVPTHAQTNLDSLWSVWSDKESHDTVRLDALNEYTLSEAQFNHPDTAHKTAMLLLESALQTEQLFYQAKAYDHLGRIEDRKRNLTEALQYENKALQIFKNLNEKYEIATTYWDLGVTFLNMGSQSKSLECHLKSLDLLEELDKSTSGILNNIGVIYNDLKDDAKALEYFQRSVQVAEQRGSYNTTALSNIGDLYLQQGNPAKALDIYNEVKTWRENNKDGYFNSTMCMVLMDIAKANVELTNFDAALENYLLSFEYYRKDSIARGSSFIRSLEIELGKYYIRTGNMDSAIDWCGKGLKKEKEASSIKYQSNACQCLYTAYKNKGDNRNALKYYETFQMLNDSLKLEETAKSIQKMEFARIMLADSLKQEEEKLQLELIHEIEIRKKNNQRNIFFSSGLLAFLIAFGLWNRLRYTRKSKSIIEKEKDRSEKLLLNILPSEIAEELKSKGQSSPRDFEQVTILFTDFKEFTQISEKIGAKELVSEINTCFEAFDGICEKYQIEKIKTIGDAYMAAGGLPVSIPNSVKNTVLAAIDMQVFITQRKSEKDISGQMAFEMRAGINSGPVVAGIVGVKKFQYDIWGDTVNIASRMESHGNVGQVNISQSTYELLKNDPDFVFESRGKIQTKGKGEVEMYFVRRI